MILSVKDQNKSLANAAKQSKDTSHRSLTANKYAAKVASSKSPSRNVVSESRQKIQAAGQSDKVRGSFEGLENASPAYILMNDTGYAAKKHQRARYSKNIKTKIGGSFDFNSFTNETKSSIIDNYSSSTMRDSSSDRLSKIIKNNMMFT